MKPFIPPSRTGCAARLYGRGDQGERAMERFGWSTMVLASLVLEWLAPPRAAPAARIAVAISASAAGDRAGGRAAATRGSSSAGPARTVFRGHLAVTLRLWNESEAGAASVDGQALSDQPGDGPATLRRPAADRGRRAGRGVGGRGAARAGQGPLGAHIRFGADYIRHDGGGTDINKGVITPQSDNFFYGGPRRTSTSTCDDAIYQPLVARQVLNARQWDIQTAKNDALLMTADAYFKVHQYRGMYAGALYSVERGHDLVERIAILSKELVPTVEVDRAKNMRRGPRAAERLRRVEAWRVVQRRPHPASPA